MTTRRAAGMIGTVVAVALGLASANAEPAGTTAREVAAAKPAQAASAPEVAAAKPARGDTKPKSRRVLIFGTTIVGDVLKPPVDRTIPWQGPPAFLLNPAPLTHDFTRELLTPLDRERLMRDIGDHGH